ncbi:MAG: hypothetical protein CSA81_09650 [Acidobacteria bacterium]|nr:MAG: hypothetical protein CSA81_09650 [Acidobacteriota bacterium]
MNSRFIPHKRILLILLVSLCILFPAFPHLFTALVILALTICSLYYHRIHPGIVGLLIALGTIPLFLIANPISPPPQKAQVEQALNKAVDIMTNPTMLKQHSHLFKDWEAHRVEIASLFESFAKQHHMSITLTDLNFKPKIWAGSSFSGMYHSAIQGKVSWSLKGNRAYLVGTHPFPSSSHATCFIMTECLFISGNTLDRVHSWLENPFLLQGHQPRHWIGTQLPHTNDYQVVFLPRANWYGSQNAELVDLLPVELNWIPHRGSQTLKNTLSSCWSLILALLLLVCFHSKNRLPDVTWFLALLAFPFDLKLDHYEVFSNTLFAAGNFGNLFASPFHLLTGSLLIYLAVNALLNKVEASDNLLHRILENTLLFSIFLFAFVPDWLQTNTPISLSQPKEAFMGSGSFLVFTGVMACLALYATLLLQLKKATKTGLFVLASSLLVFYFFVEFKYFITCCSYFLILLIGMPLKEQMTHSTQLKKRSLVALISAAAFLFQLQVSGTERLHRFIARDWQQDITLIDHANHNRVMRLLDALKLYQGQYHSSNPYLTHWLAKRSGLVDESIGYSLRLLNLEGRVISSIENQLSLDAIPHALFAKNRIEYFQENPASPKMLLFRKGVEFEDQSCELIIALSNSYENITSIQRLSPLFKTAGQELPFKHGNVSVRVFDTAGKPLNELENPDLLPENVLLKLQSQPFFSITKASTTCYYFNDGYQLYQVRVQPLSIVTILSRLVLLFSFCWGIVILAQRHRKLKKRSLLSLFRRSFRVKLASLFLFVSLIPMVLLISLFLVYVQSSKSSDKRLRLIQRSQQIVKKLQKADFLTTGEQDINLYVSGSLKKTTRPELFHSSTLPSRIPYRAYEALRTGQSRFITGQAVTERGLHLDVLYTVVKPGTILSITEYSSSIHLRDAFFNSLEQILAATLLILLATSILAFKSARVFLQPITSITRAAASMQKGIHQQPIQPLQGENELNRMILAFNSMRENIAWNERERQKQINLLTITMGTMKTGLLGLNSDGRVVLCNNAFLNFFPEVELYLHRQKSKKNPEQLTLVDQLPAISFAKMIELTPSLSPIEKQIHKAESSSLTLKLETSHKSLVFLCRIEYRPDNRDPQEIQTIILLEDITLELETNRMKAWSEMARRIAHEIKNPLTPIQLELDHLNALHRDKHPQFAKALEEATIEIKKQVQQLRNTATDFADYARPMKLNRKACTISSLVRECLSSYKRTQARILMETEFQYDPVLQIDPLVTKKAINNLIVNSFEAMEEGRIRILTKQSGERLLLVIEDNGPGIDREEKTKIFQAYFSTKTRGTGLGLAIAKKSLELQGADLRLDMDFDSGTRFLITFPMPI